MARELGVNARVGYGWAGGKYFEINNTFVFRAREAHAWVEVKLEGYGWVLMEPTPPVAFGEGLPRVAEVGEKMPTQEEILSEELAAMDKGAENFEGWALGLTGVFGVGAVILVLFRGRMREGVRREVGGSAAKRKEMGYFSIWLRALAKRGIRNEMGLTVRRQIEDLENAPDFSEELIRYHYAIRYEGEQADPKRERRIEREIEKWRDS